jgi:hypothetical protein
MGLALVVPVAEAALNVGSVIAKPAVKPVIRSRVNQSKIVGIAPPGPIAREGVAAFIKEVFIVGLIPPDGGIFPLTPAEDLLTDMVGREDLRVPIGLKRTQVISVLTALTPIAVDLICVLILPSVTPVRLLPPIIASTGDGTTFVVGIFPHNGNPHRRIGVGAPRSRPGAERARLCQAALDGAGGAAGCFGLTGEGLRIARLAKFEPTAITVTLA